MCLIFFFFFLCAYLQGLVGWVWRGFSLECILIGLDSDPFLIGCLSWGFHFGGCFESVHLCHSLSISLCFFSSLSPSLYLAECRWLSVWCECVWRAKTEPAVGCLVFLLCSAMLWRGDRCPQQPQVLSGQLQCMLSKLRHGVDLLSKRSILFLRPNVVWDCLILVWTHPSSGTNRIYTKNKTLNSLQPSDVDVFQTQAVGEKHLLNIFLKHLIRKSPEICYVFHTRPKQNRVAK